MPFISHDKLQEIKVTAYRDGAKAERKDNSKNIENYKDKIEDLERRIERANAKVKVLQDDRDGVHKVMQQKLENADMKTQLEGARKILDNRTKELEKREKVIDTKEEGNYKKGYADGVSDGLRKIHEITAEDRQNLTKIAMVSAARGTAPEAVEGVTSALRLTEGSSDSKSK